VIETLYQQGRQHQLNGEERRTVIALALGRAFARFVETWAGAPAELCCHAHLLAQTLEGIESETLPRVLAHVEQMTEKLTEELS